MTATRPGETCCGIFERRFPVSMPTRKLAHPVHTYYLRKESVQGKPPIARGSVRRIAVLVPTFAGRPAAGDPLNSGPSN